MKLSKNLALMGACVGAVLVYQKYGAPAMKKAEKAVSRSLRKLDNKINQMM